MRVQTGKAPWGLEFALKKGRSDTTIVADDAGHGIIAMLQKVVDMAKSDCDRAMDLAHRLSFEVRTAEERARELEAEAKAADDRARAFEAEANHFGDRAARAEEWFVRIHSEVEQTFFQKRAQSPRAAVRSLSDASTWAA
jgi:hypothetical protein